MTIAQSLIALRACLRRFAGNRQGVSAVEFALMLPIMLTLYLGGVELGDGFGINFKSTISARTVADLASQYVTIDNSTMSTILGAATTVVAPYSANNMSVTVSEVTINNKGVATITWSDSLNGTAHTVGTVITLPASLQTPNISLIWGEVSYPYKPQMGYVVTGTITMYQSIFFYPRLSSSVTRVNS
jgi:Flp pilus assembly protein TadG